MKSKYILYIITLIALAIQYGCVKDTDFPTDMINAKIPQIITKDSVISTATSITVFAEVVKENGMPVTEYGAYWSYKSPVDTINDTRISVGKGKGEFSVTIDGLKKDTTYYITPYAINKKGIALGDELSKKTTTGLGIVSTFSVMDTTGTTALLGGKIRDKGEGEIVSRGIYLSTKPGFKQPEMRIESTMQSDSFTCKVAGLSPSTKYYYKAFVDNTFGTFVGEEMNFTTTKGLPFVSGLTKIKIGFYDAEFQAVVTDEGDSPVKESGFCWRENGTPTIDDNILACSKGAGVFHGKIEELAQNVKYNIRAYAINSYGVSYSEDIVFSPLSDSPTVTIHKDNVSMGIGIITIEAEVLDEGLSSVVESGLCWSTANGRPDLTDHNIALSAGKNTFSGTIENLVGGTTYYVRAYAKNELKTEFSEVYSFTTPPIFVKKTSLNEVRIQGTTRFCNSEQNAFLLGGDAGAEYTNEFWSYDVVIDRWFKMQPYPERKVSGQTPVFMNDNIYVLGGKKEGSLTNSFYSYSSYRNEWVDISDLSNVMPAPVTLSSGCTLNQAVYYMGGQTESSIISDVWKYSPVSKIWENVGNLPESQYGGIALVIDNVIYAGLGLNDMSRSSNNKKLWASSNGGNSWNAKASIPNAASQIIGGVVYKNKIYVIDNNAQIWQYSPESDDWKAKSKLYVLDKNVHCIYVLNDGSEKIYIGFGSRSDQFITYDPDWDN